MRPARFLEQGTIRRRLIGSIVVLAALPVPVLATSLFLLGRIAGDARQLGVAESLRSSGFAIAANLNAHLARSDPALRAEVEAELGRMETSLAVLEQGSLPLRVEPVGDPRHREHVLQARRALEHYRTVAERFLAELERGGVDATARRRAGHELLAAVQGLVTLTRDLAEELERGSAAALRQLWLFQAVAVLVALGVTLLTLWAVNRYILQPIPSLQAALSEVSGGRYGVRVEARGQNELSDLVRGFNAMSSALEKAHHDLVLKQAEILEKNAELERANRLKSQFVANMSHELRTPLNAIIGYTKLLQSGVYGELPEKTREPLAGVDETSGVLLRLIDDILDVAKIEAGRMDLHLEPLRVEDVAREVGEMLQPLAIGKGLELYVEAEGGLPKITSDRDKVRRILLNLGGNAIKFTRHGRVELEVLSVRPAGAGDAEPFVEVAVRDTGIGIAPEHLESIFDDFRQVEGGMAREHSGTGLGLAISRRLARHLGGDVRVESKLGRGSTFLLRLPLFVRIDGPAPGAAAASQASSSSPRATAGFPAPPGPPAPAPAADGGEGACRGAVPLPPASAAEGPP